ncbi:MAG: hypothetical protein OXU27_08585 [Candidatus Poribacteria bacterium]|nr:hypothetical protein [Candidatus Poribacteria bacterium]
MKNYLGNSRRLSETVSMWDAKRAYLQTRVSGNRLPTADSHYVKSH